MIESSALACPQIDLLSKVRAGGFHGLHGHVESKKQEACGASGATFARHSSPADVIRMGKRAHVMRLASADVPVTPARIRA